MMARLSPKGTPLASKGALDDSSSGNEPIWLSIAKDKKREAETSFRAAGGKTINPHWAYVEISWLVKVKTDAEGNVIYEEWKQPHGEADHPTVLTKPKILCVDVQWLRVEEAGRNKKKRYVLSAADYQRLLDACK